MGGNQNLPSTCAGPKTIVQFVFNLYNLERYYLGISARLSHLTEVKQIVETFKLSSQGQSPLRLYLQKAQHILVKTTLLVST